MFATVVPVLKNQDAERQKKIRAMVSGLLPKRPPGRGKKISISIASSDAQDLLTNIQKLQRSEALFRQQCVVAVVSRFDDFYTYLLAIVLKANPSWLKTSEKTLTYKELIELGSVDRAIDAVVDKEIDNLMRGSHAEQIAFLDDRLKLGVKEHFPQLPEFLEVTERRNLFVHTGGKVSQLYLDKCAGFDYSVAADVKLSTVLDVTKHYFENAFKAAFELALRISQASYRRLFPQELGAADRALNHLAIRFLMSADWELAEIVAAFDVALPAHLRCEGEDFYFAMINRAIARKFNGKEFKSCLQGVTWDAFHPKYKLALQVLDDDFVGASKTMANSAVKDAVGRIAFRTWPLFRQFRSTTAFAKTYKELFHETYIPDPQRDAADLKKLIDKPAVTTAMTVARSPIGPAA